MKFYGFCKRALDILLSLSSLLLIWPVLLIIAIAIRISSKGPAVFRQERAGKCGKPFTLYKFRTMKVDIDPYGSSPKSGSDPRLISIGKFLREYSLDELPQIYNVLKGDMSVVGPRPSYVSQAEEWKEYHKQLLEVKPGLTGLSQVRGRASLTHEAKLDIEVEYVKTRSFWLDLKLIFMTFGVLFGRKGVYEVRYSEKELSRGDNEL